MENDTVFALHQPGEFEDLLTDVLRQGARQLLAQAVEAEVADFLAGHGDLTIEDGRQRLVRHGHLPERTIQTGIGSVEVQQPPRRDYAPCCATDDRLYRSLSGTAAATAGRSVFHRLSCRLMPDDRTVWMP